MRQRIRRYRRLAVAFAAIVAVLGIGLTAAHAFTNANLDSQATTSLCADADGNVNDNVFGNSLSTCGAAQDQLFTTTAQNICDGSNVVEDGQNNQCPFDAGYNINHMFVGDKIVQIWNGDQVATAWLCQYHQCRVHQSHGGAYTAWVIDGNCGGTNGCEFISVAGTNDWDVYGQYWAACSNGSGHDLVTENTPASSTGRCFWKTS
jgi:hypothetical protein